MTDYELLQVFGIPLLWEVIFGEQMMQNYREHLFAENFVRMNTVKSSKHRQFIEASK